jgi:predicted nucleic acid-binding protein
MRIYADTSVFGGVFDVEFAEPTRRLFEEIDAGRFTLVTSALVEAEIEPAPEKIRLHFSRYETLAEIAQITQETHRSATGYVPILRKTSINAVAK